MIRIFFFREDFLDDFLITTIHCKISITVPQYWCWSCCLFARMLSCFARGDDILLVYYLGVL